MRLKVVVSYDGSGYGGWQKQNNTQGIQDIIEKCLSRIEKEPVTITASGRTDAGVHAIGQVFHFDTKLNVPERGFQEALNSMLPKDIRIKSVKRVNDDFHARFSPSKKIYEYIFTTERDNPFAWKYKTWTKKPLDLKAMQDASAQFLGEHDFTSFTNAQIDPRKSRVRVVDRIQIWQDGDDVHLLFQANGFLRYQVRMMSAALERVGHHLMTGEDIKELLNHPDKDAFRFNAAPGGLYLKEVLYKE